MKNTVFYEEAIIGGRKVVVNKFPGRLGLKLLTKITKLLGPRIAEIIGGIESKDTTSILDSDFNMARAEIALKELFNALDFDEHFSFMLEFLSMTTIDNEPITEQTFDKLFQGNIQDIFKIVWFAFKVNYSAFLSEGVLDKILNFNKKMD